LTETNASTELLLHHISDISEAHEADSIGVSVSGFQYVTSGTVQGALKDLDDNLFAATGAVNNALQDHLDDTTDAHDASAISFIPGSSVYTVGSEVQTALEQIDTGLNDHVADSGVDDVHGATASNTVNAIVRRDASGNFTAGTITASLSGNAATATTATNANNVDVDLNSANQNQYVVFVGGSIGNQKPRVDSGILYNPSTNILDLNGGFRESGTSTLSNDISGNASTASTLQTSRTISLTGDATGSTSFNGGSNVSINTTVTTATNANNIEVDLNSANQNQYVLFVGGPNGNQKPLVDGGFRFNPSSNVLEVAGGFTESGSSTLSNNISGNAATSNNGVNSLSFNETNGFLNLSRSAGSISADLDGRYIVGSNRDSGYWGSTSFDTGSGSTGVHFIDTTNTTVTKTLEPHSTHVCFLIGVFTQNASGGTTSTGCFVEISGANWQLRVNPANDRNACYVKCIRHNAI
jgi:hypothetical protein